MVRNVHSFVFPIRKFDDPVGLHKNFRYMEDYLKRLSIAGGGAQGPTVIFAPSDFAEPEKANVVLDGTTDAAVIQTYLDLGGWLHFLPGTVNLEATLLTPFDSRFVTTLFTGSGWETIFKMTVAQSRAFFISFQQRFTMRDFVVDCNSFATSGGIGWESCIQFHADRVWVKNSANKGFDSSSSETFSLVNCLASDNTGRGFELIIDSLNEDARIIGCTAIDNTDDGFFVALAETATGTLVGNVSTDNGGWGFDFGTATVVNTGYVASNNTSGNVNSGGGSAHGMEDQVYIPGDHGGLVIDHDVATNVSADDHHTEAHTVASHSDTTATGAELETLTDGSDSDGLHDHPVFLLLDGTRAMTGALSVDQPSTTGAVPVITLDQADVDEDFLKVIGTSDTNVDRALVDAVDFGTPGSIVGWIKINVQDDQTTDPIVDGDYYIPFYGAPSA